MIKPLEKQKYGSELDEGSYEEGKPLTVEHVQYFSLFHLTS